MSQSKGLQGRNEIRLNEATMLQVVQYYFDMVLFSVNKAPKATGIKVENNIDIDNPWFVVDTMQELEGDDEPKT